MQAAKRAEDLNAVLSEFPDAMKQNPRMVAEMAGICLSFQHGDISLAITSMASYLAWRTKLLGDLGDHIIESDEKLKAQLDCKFIHLSPTRLKNGSALLYLSMKNHDPSIYSTKDTLKCLHFFLLTAMMNDPTLAEAGFVIINDMAEVAIWQLDIHFPVEVAGAVGKSIPIRLLSMVLVTPPLLVRFLVPILRAVLPEKLFGRLHVAHDRDALPTLLQADQASLPVPLGGSVEFDKSHSVQHLVAKQWRV